MSLAAVFQIGSLGDSIVSVPSLLSIKELLPDCTEYLLVSKVDVDTKVAPNHVFNMAWRATADINYSTNGGHIPQLRSIGTLIKQLRYYRPKYCVYLMPSDRSEQQVRRDKLFFKAGGVHHLIGFRTLTTKELTLGITPSANDTEAYLRFRRLWNHNAEANFAKYSSMPVLRPSQDASQHVQRWLSQTRRYPSRRLVAMCPYSNSPSKDIPISVSSELLRRLEKEENVEVIVLGGRKDLENVQALVQQASAGINACGNFSIEESAALLRHCELAICSDSGPMHLAAAVGTPTVVAFSRMNKQLSRWFPMGAGHKVLYRNVICAGCRSVKCPYEDHPCMKDITSDQLLYAATNVLHRHRTSLLAFNSTRVAQW